MRREQAGTGERIAGAALRQPEVRQGQRARRARPRTTTSPGSTAAPRLPVEITAEFENWRRIRDWEGAEGWVYHSLLSGRRTALVAPQSKGKDELLELRAKPDAARRRDGASCSPACSAA